MSKQRDTAPYSKLKDYLTEEGLMTMEFAEQIGMSPGAISNWS